MSFDANRQHAAAHDRSPFDIAGFDAAAFALAAADTELEEGIRGKAEGVERLALSPGNMWTSCRRNFRLANLGYSEQRDSRRRAGGI
jgi:hypothetical protein